mmetsp:Transcript_19073/g.41112  ORF Transcript_19073/g.41112 Transcript_19073/m.41112 type:complete len:246 (-) Transcript_19073:924-1661(-)
MCGMFKFLQKALQAEGGFKPLAPLVVQQLRHQHRKRAWGLLTFSHTAASGLLGMLMLTADGCQAGGGQPLLVALKQADALGKAASVKQQHAKVPDLCGMVAALGVDGPGDQRLPLSGQHAELHTGKGPVVGLDGFTDLCCTLIQQSLRARVKARCRALHTAATQQDRVCKVSRQICYITALAIASRGHSDHRVCHAVCSGGSHFCITILGEVSPFMRVPCSTPSSRRSASAAPASPPTAGRELPT